MVRRLLLHSSVGLLVNVVLVLVFPNFFTRIWELCLAPFGLGLLGLFAALLPGRRESTKRNWQFFAGCAALCLLAYAARYPARNWIAEPRALVLAIDSAGWNFIDPLVAAGDLPTHQKLIEQGTSGPLRTVEPIYSPVIWTTVATGMNPEKHGVGSFYALQEEVQEKRIWEILNEAGVSTGVFRWWVTWPPKPVDGFLIPGILAQDSRTYPPQYSFVNKVRADMKSGARVTVVDQAEFLWHFMRNGLRLETALASLGDLVEARRIGNRQFSRTAKRRIEMRLNADLFAHLLRTYGPEYAAFYDNGIDVVCHEFFKFLEPEKYPGVRPEQVEIFGEIIPDYYRLTDEVLGELLRHMSPETNVFLLSDHGQQASVDAGNSEKKVRIPLVSAIVEDLGMTSDFYGISLALRTFVESVKLDPAERLAALEEASVRLSAIKIAGSERPVLQVRILEDDRLELKIDGEVDPAKDQIDLGNRQVPVSSWVSDRGTQSGSHTLDGILIARGPSIRQGARIEGATVQDITPTLLYLLGLPVSEQFDGAVLESLLVPDYLKRNPVRSVASFGTIERSGGELSIDQERIDKLRALGYVQ